MSSIDNKLLVCINHPIHPLTFVSMKCCPSLCQPLNGLALGGGPPRGGGVGPFKNLQSKTHRLLLFSRRCQTNRLNKRTHFHCDFDLHPSTLYLIHIKEKSLVWSKMTLPFLISQNHCSRVFTVYGGLTKLRDDNGV